MSNQSDSLKLTSISFAQTEKLTTRLSGLIRSYPRGVGLVQEFVQNADDAGATHVSVWLDMRTHSSTQLSSNSMAILQGPAIVITNNADFTNQDWERLQTIGFGSKVFDSAKTGRFGLGFNSVYNVTDFPEVLIGDKIGIFDPHGCTVDGASFQHPGNAWKLGEPLWAHSSDLLAPFIDFGLEHGASHYSGTAFRLSLRTPEQAKKSEICSIPFLCDDYFKIIEKLGDRIGELLLFLKCVTHIDIGYIDKGGARRNMLSAHTLNVSEVHSARSPLIQLLDHDDYHSLLSAIRKRKTDLVVNFNHDIEIINKAEISNEIWNVTRGIFSGNDNNLVDQAEEMYKIDQKAVPLTGIASLKSSSRNRDIEGRIFCGLPLPVKSPIDFCHVDGFFDLQSDRQGLFEDSEAEGSAQVRVEWNKALIQHGCAIALALHCIEYTKENCAGLEPYGVWPRVISTPQNLLEQLGKWTYVSLAGFNCILTGISRGLYQPADVFVLPNNSPENMEDALLADKFSLPKPCLPLKVVEGFGHAGYELNELTPAILRNDLREESFNYPFSLDNAPRECLSQRAWVLALLQHCIADKHVEELAGLPLALLASGQVQVFRVSDKQDIYLAGATERGIFKSVPYLFLDMDAQRLPNMKACVIAGIHEMTPQLVLNNLSQILPEISEQETSIKIAELTEPPDNEWLANVFMYLSANQMRIELDVGIANTLAMVPDQFGCLSQMGYSSTPLLASKEDTSRVSNAMTYFKVPVVTGDNVLLSAVRKFVDAYPESAIWRIQACDLIDAIDFAEGPQHQDSDSVNFEPCIHGVVLDILSRTQGLAALNDDEDRVKVLKSLRLFSTNSGQAVGLDSGEYYVPLGYTLPKIDVEVGFLSTGPEKQWAPLLKVLGVTELTRYRYVFERLIPLLGSLEKADLLTASLWLRMELQGIRSEVGKEEASDLLKRLKYDLPVFCLDNSKRSVSELYHPSANVVVQLLGNVTGIPDMNVYDSHPELWLEFFEALGMATRPRADDIVRAIDMLLKETNENGTSCIKQLTEIVDYLENNWDKLNDEPVEMDELKPEHVNPWYLSDALEYRSWLPTLSTKPRGFPGELLAHPAKQFAKPSELFTRESLDLVSCIHPICLLDRISRLGRGIGLKSDPDVNSVIYQLKQICKFYQANGQDGHRTRVRRMLQNIYRYLGSHFRSDEESLDQQEQVQMIRKSFANVQCVFDEDGALHLPGVCFENPVSEFIGRAVCVRAGESDVNLGLAVLGRRDAPNLEDYRRLFTVLGEEWAQNVLEDEKKQLLRKAYQMAALLSGPGDLADVPILMDNGCIGRDDKLVLDDAPWLSERIRDAGIQIIDTELSRDVAVAFEICQLSSAVYEISTRIEESSDYSFRQRCQGLQEKLQSNEFSKGIDRLLVANGGEPSRKKITEFFLDMSIEPVRHLETVLVWQDSNETIEKSVGTADVLFDPDKNALTASESADQEDDLADLIAAAIVHELECDGIQLGDMREKVSLILRSSPAHIQSKLDKFKVPRLPDETNDSNFEFDDSAGFIDSDAEYSNDGINGVGEVDEEYSDPIDDDKHDQGIVEVNGMEPGNSDSDSVDPVSTSSPDFHKASSNMPERNDAPRKQNSGNVRGEPSIEPNNPIDLNEENQSETQNRADSTELNMGHPMPSSFRELGRSGSKRPRGDGEGKNIARRNGPRSGNGDSHGKGWTAVTRVASKDQSSKEESQHRQENRQRVDKKAIERVLAFEQERGRRAKEMPHDNIGYDIESYLHDETIERYIEVKGLSGAWSGFAVSISRAQHRKAVNEGDGFWLYVVEFALESDRARVFAIRNPGELIDQYWFDDGWKLLSTEQEGPGTGSKPTVGATVIVDGSSGLIKSIRTHGILMHLQIAYDDGRLVSMVYNPRRIIVKNERGTK